MKLPRVTEEWILQRLVGENLILKLYQSDVTPGWADGVKSFVECNFVGYRPALLRASDWVLNLEKRSATAVERSFASQAAQFQLVYGYFAVRETGGVLMWAERFPLGPYQIVNSGDVIKVRSVIQFGR